MRIHSNALALNAGRNLAIHNSRIATALERISSGFHINRAADDAAGLGISERMKAQLAQLDANHTSAIYQQSMLTVADSALNSVQSLLGRMAELADMAANGTYSDADRRIMNEEYQQLLSEINRIGGSSSFNGHKLFDSKINSFSSIGAEIASDAGTELVLEGNNLDAFLDGLDKLLLDISNAARLGDEDKLLSLGIDRSNGKSDSENLRDAITLFTKEQGSALLSTPGDSDNGASYRLRLSGGQIRVDMTSISDEALNLKDTNILSQEDARKAAASLKKAMEKVSSQRADIGATYNRLEFTLDNIATMQVNLTEALSRILDADMAMELMILAKEQVLAQVSVFAMAQANQKPNQVLSMIQELGSKGNASPV